MDLNSIISGIILFILTVHVAATFKRWQVQDRKAELYRHKVDALVHAWTTLGKTLGEHFKTAYEDKLGELISESNFKNG